MPPETYVLFRNIIIVSSGMGCKEEPLPYCLCYDSETNLRSEITTILSRQRFHLKKKKCVGEGTPMHAMTLAIL